MIKNKTKENATPKAGMPIGAVGRRKSAVARVWLRKGTGGVAINSLRCADYFKTDETRTIAVQSLIWCDALKNYDVVVNVKGGGLCAQADAIRLGIARALLKDNEAFKTVLRDRGALTVDDRNKERKKPGQRGARRKFQFVKR